MSKTLNQSSPFYLAIKVKNSKHGLWAHFLVLRLPVNHSICPPLSVKTIIQFLLFSIS